MRCKILFRLSDRSEHEFVVEGDNQSDWYVEGRTRLVAKLGGNMPGCSMPTIESWQTFPESGAPGVDKADGVAARSPLQKIRFDLLPIIPLVEVAKVFTFGAATYGDRNWEAGFSWSRCIGSIWRHLTKWIMGENHDDESGLNHLAHVIANCMFLLQYTYTKSGTDDRPVEMSDEFIAKLFKPVAIKTQQKEQ